MDLTNYLPTLVRFEPTVADTNVPTVPTISAYFSTEIAVSQINTNVGLNQQIFLTEELTGVRVPLIFGSYAARKLEFTPATALHPGVTYIVTVLGTLKSPEGRATGIDRTWAFTVALGALSAPTLITPSNLSAVSSLPVLSWSTATSSVSGAISYQVDLDISPEFASIGSQGWTTLTPAASTAIGLSLTPRTTYWWRVSAIQGGIAGPPSDPFAFYLGVFGAASPETTSLYTPSDSVPLFNFDNGASDNKAWPNLSITFPGGITPLVDGVNLLLQRTSVDGYQKALDGPVAFTHTVSGNVVTIFPTDLIKNNSRYTLMFRHVFDTAGNPLTIQDRFFTSAYNPLYLGFMVLRANFGALLDEYSDEFLNFHIYRTSLDVNRHYIRAFPYGPFRTGPTEEQVRNYQFPLTYPMERWVEHESARRILSEILRTRIITAGKSKRLGDFEESTQSGIIQEIKLLLDEERKEAAYWIQEFSRKSARVATARKSEYYDRGRLNIDLSSPERRREF